MAVSEVCCRSLSVNLHAREALTIRAKMRDLPPLPLSQQGGEAEGSLSGPRGAGVPDGGGRPSFSPPPQRRGEAGGSPSRSWRQSKQLKISN